jgi:arylsulfatase A
VKKLLHRIIFCISFLGMIGVVSAGAVRSPNIVLIMADDVSWEAFGCYGGEDYKTPNIDQLAANGVRFNQCYSTPLCTPSRVMIMTGQYNFRNYTDFGFLDPECKTFGHLMQQAGYKTAIAGKWQLNGLYSKNKHRDWNDNKRPFKAGFDEYCLWQLTKGKSDKDGGGERFWSSPLEINGRFVTSVENAGVYTPDIMSDFVCDFIEKHRNEPFFVYYPTVLVHDPFVPTPETIGNAARDQSANEQPDDTTQVKRNFVAMVEYLDLIVGKVVRKLEEVGQLENTLILFTADNGTNEQISSIWNGQRIDGGKGAMTDMGTHVPLVVYWKGRTEVGAVIDDLVDFSDFFPTIAAAADITLAADDPIDGRSFLPQAMGEAGNPRDWVLCHYQPYWGRFDVGKFVRTAEYKLYGDGRFYHVPQDLYEKHNLAGNVPTGAVAIVNEYLKTVLEHTPDVPGFRAGSKPVPFKKISNRVVHPGWDRIPDFD